MVGTVKDILIRQDIEEQGSISISRFTDHVKVVFVKKGTTSMLSSTKGKTVEVIMNPDQLELWVRSRPAKRQRVR